MISPVSSVSFGNNKDLKAIINEPGKYSSATVAQAQPQAQAAPAADTMEYSENADIDAGEKKHTGAIIGGIVAGLFLIWAGLGLAVGKGKLDKWADLADDGLVNKGKKLLYKIGESAKKAYDGTIGKLFKKDPAKTTGEGNAQPSTPQAQTNS